MGNDSPEIDVITPVCGNSHQHNFAIWGYCNLYPAISLLGLSWITTLDRSKWDGSNCARARAQKTERGSRSHTTTESFVGTSARNLRHCDSHPVVTARAAASQNLQIAGNPDPLGVVGNYRVMDVMGSWDILSLGGQYLACVSWTVNCQQKIIVSKVFAFSDASGTCLRTVAGLCIAGRSTRSQDHLRTTSHPCHVGHAMLAQSVGSLPWCSSPKRWPRSSWIWRTCFQNDLGYP
jgi:hypothetical protein